MVSNKDLADLSAAVYTNYTFADLNRPIANNTSWTLANFISDSGTGFYGAVYQNPQGQTVAAIRGMELLTQDAGTVAQLQFGIKPPAFNSALQFYTAVKAEFGTQVTYTGHSLGGAEVDYIAAKAASEGITITGVTFGAIGIGAILTTEGINTFTLTGLTNYVHPNDVAKLVGVPVGVQVEVPYTRSVMENIGALLGPNCAGGYCDVGQGDAGGRSRYVVKT